MTFTLCHAYSSVGTGSLVLRHSAPYSPPNSGGIVYSVAEHKAMLSLDAKEKQIFKMESNLQPVTFTVSPCA